MHRIPLCDPIGGVADKWPLLEINAPARPDKSQQSPPVLPPRISPSFKPPFARIRRAAPFYYWSRTPPCCRCNCAPECPRTMRKSQTLSTAPVNGTCCESATCLTARQMKSTAAVSLLQKPVAVHARPSASACASRRALTSAASSGSGPRRAAESAIAQSPVPMVTPCTERALPLVQAYGMHMASGWLPFSQSEGRKSAGIDEMLPNTFRHVHYLLPGRFYQPGHGGLSRQRARSRLE